MKLLKKLTMMLLAIGMMASVVACGGAGEGEESSTETSQTSEVKEVGQNLTETEFQAAVQELYAQKNLVLTVTGEEKSDGKMTYSGTMSFADGKTYQEMVSVADGVTSTEYLYMGAVDGTTYVWMSSDKTVWDCLPADDVPVSPRSYLEEVFMWCGFDYCKFNNKTEMMEFTGLGAPSVNVKVVDNKIVEFRYEDIDGNWYAATITYGGAVIGELPALD